MALLANVGLTIFGERVGAAFFAVGLTAAFLAGFATAFLAGATFLAGAAFFAAAFLTGLAGAFFAGAAFFAVGLLELFFTGAAFFAGLATLDLVAAFLPDFKILLIIAICLASRPQVGLIEP